MAPPQNSVTRANRSAARLEGQVRVMWDDTPIDLFLVTHEFHRTIAARVREVPFEETSIPVLDCASLIVFKAMFNRTRDWADVEEILNTGDDDGKVALKQIKSLLGEADPIAVRLAALIG